MVSACGNNENTNTSSVGASQSPSPSPSSSPSAPASSEEPQALTIKHHFGETEVPLHPQRVAVVGLEDIALSLGAPLVYAYGFEGYYLYDRLEALNIQLSDSPNLKPNLEAILASKPDLIVLQGYFSDQQGYDELSKIAPTIAFTPDDWKSNIVLLGQALGLQDKAQEVIATYNDKLTQAKDAIVAAAGSSNSAVFLRPSDKELQVFFPSFAPLIYDELGLRPDASIAELQKASKEDWGINTSLEKLPSINADYVFAIYGGSISSAEDFAKETAASDEVEKLKIWKSLPAVKNNRVFKVSARTWMSSGPIAEGYVIDDVKAAVTGTK
ncbi:iron-siderophore ABC transporter substrate-binding protein [Cohnella herbarum]|uniref:Iron-siderophore ABC transporter substrate-binding protein n=2 Tax=Cohnella herbarum TaxID=2728023 RepID=A0A7Z2VSE7_9BACL|nr:iron-siderophore ABC transporter substrate-binding protein [Cohnella herbarum]